MRLHRSRRRNLVLLSTHEVRPYNAGLIAKAGRRRRFRILRTGALLSVMGVLRLTQLARYRWRLSLGLAGLLLEVLGHSVFAGPARGAADLVGLTVILVAFLKSGDPARSRRPAAVPQAASRWQG
jgi:hypothetical protein